MPADAREQIRQLPSGKWQLRYYDRKGVRHSGGAFPSKSAARAHYRDVIEPGLNGKPVARRDLTYSDLVEVFLERHAIVAKPRTITELRWRLKQSEAKFGTVPLVELEGMADEIAGFAVTISERLRHPLMAAFRQALEAGVRYGYLTRNPAKLAGPNPMPAPREIRVYTAAELDGDHRGAGNRGGGRCDVRGGDRAATLGVGVGRAQRRRQGPAGAAGAGHEDDPVTARGAAHAGRRSTRSSRCRPGSTAATCSRPRGSARRRASRARSTSRTSAVASGGRRSTRPGSRSPRRLYDLRSTFASNALAAGITMFELARIMGTSAKMIEPHYGTLIDTAHDAILTRLEGFGA